MSVNDEIQKIYFDQKPKLSSNHNTSKNELVVLDTKSPKVHTSEGDWTPVRRLSIKDLPFEPSTSAPFPSNVKTIADALEYLINHSGGGEQTTGIFPSAMLTLRNGALESGSNVTLPFDEQYTHYTKYNVTDLTGGIISGNRVILDPGAADLPADSLYSAKVTISAFLSLSEGTEAAKVSLTAGSETSDYGSETFSTDDVAVGIDTVGIGTLPVSLDVLFVNITKATDRGIWVSYTSDKALWAPKFYVTVTYIPQKKVIDVLSGNALYTNYFNGEEGDFKLATNYPEDKVLSVQD